MPKDASDTSSKKPQKKKTAGVKRRTATVKRKSEGSMSLASAMKVVTGKKDATQVSTFDYFSAYTYGIDILKYPLLCKFLGSDVLPLSRSMSIVGAEESLKSSLAWFLQRIILLAGGFVIYIDTEKKQNGKLIMYIVDYPDAFDPDNPRILPIPCVGRSEARDHLRKFTGHYKELTGGRLIPMGILWDSLKAGVPDEVLKADATDKATKGFADMHEAKRFQDSFQVAVSKNITENPILFTAVNHETYNPAGPGKTGGTFSSVGGHFKDYNWSWNIRLRKGAPDVKAARTVAATNIKTFKTSLGEAQPSAVRVEFEVRRALGQTPVARFNWDKALALLLATPELFPKSRSLEVLNVRHLSGNNFLCSALGFTEAKTGTGAVRGEVIGRAISESPEWRERVVYEIFGIDRGGRLIDGVIYQELTKDTAMAKRAPSKRRGSVRGIPIQYMEQGDPYPGETIVDNAWPEGVADGTDYDVVTKADDEPDEVEAEDETGIELNDDEVEL